MTIEHEIRDFLMSRRARLTPAQAGMPHLVGGDRRVPGLRREEVAMLAGLSVEYYTKIERGKLGGASDAVIDSIGRALQLDDDELAHLRDLARNVTPPRRPVRAASGAVTDSARQVLRAMAVPALVQNDRLDILIANDLGRALYAPLLEDTNESPNFARFAFLDPRAESFYVDIDDARNLVVAVLRGTAGRDPLERSVSDLVGELSARSSDFGRRWAKHDVRRHLRGRKIIDHPEVGILDLTFDDFALPGDPHHSITTYTAEPGSSSADGLGLLASLVATRAQADEQSAADVRP